MDQRVSFSIGEAAKASELSVKAIRYYEEIGLIPKATRTNGGMHTDGRRIYSEAEVGRLRFIRHARLFGFSLRDIREMLALRDGTGCPSTKPEYRQILKKHLRSIDQRVGHLLGLRTAIAGLVSRPHKATATRCTWLRLHATERKRGPLVRDTCYGKLEVRRQTCVNSVAAVAGVQRGLST